ncbi:zinc finger protein 135 [Drosophila sechellia]|uniref:zinc finger protein 135 n=1 Tax=Drosophila sechellia TaxID=7238 RepID=UPI0013DDE43C|nr:zinc finger protein 135 [Drosophila sechellia]
MEEAGCRVCLRQEGDMINIFDATQDPGVSIADMITCWSGHQVERGDFLPETICPECLEDAREAFGYIQKFEGEKICKIFKSESSQIENQLEGPETNVAQKFHVKNEPVDDELYLEAVGTASNDPFEKDICKIEAEEINESSLPNYISTELDLDTIPTIPIVPSRGKRRYKCSMCSKSFATASQFSRHILTHSEDNAGSDESGSDFRNSEADTYEEDDYSPASESDMPAQKYHVKRRIKCVASIAHLKQHSLNQSNIKAKSSSSCSTTYMPYKCNYCPKYFKDKDSYRLHLRSHGKRYKCSQCPKSFANSKMHKEHTLTHSEDSSVRPKCPPSDPPNRAFKCPKCPKLFPFSSSCSRHLLSHEKTRPYQCPECPNSYARPHALRAHVLSHSKERPHKCEQCSKSYRQIYQLNAHTLTHSEEMLYKCSHCDKSFKYSSNLSRHMRLHNGDKPKECEFCSKKFSQASDLKVHIRIHTGEKPYRCANCNKKFSVLSNMSKHQRKCLS